MRRKLDGEGPLETVLHLVGAPARAKLRPYSDDPDLSGRVVVPHQITAASRRASHGSGDNDVGVLGVDGDVAALRIADGVAVAPGNGSFVGSGRNGDGRIVLLRAVYPVRELIVGGHVVELGGKLVVNGRPGFPAV